MPKVSVIIPVYNTEKYLKQCLVSVINQTFKDIEIICIDDGSTDNSLDILREYQKNDNRIKILTQDHKYAGVARNYGMSIAKGEYIFFIDSDDYIQNNTLETLFNKANDNSCEIVLMTNIITFTDENVINLTTNSRYDDIILNYQDVKRGLFFDYCNIFCNRLYKKDFLQKNNIKFAETRNGEDLALSFLSIVLTKKFIATDKLAYYYRIHKKSTNNTRSIYSNFAGYKYAQDMLKKHNVYDLVMQEFKNRLCNDTIEHLSYMKTIQDKLKVYKYIKSNHFKIFDLENYPKSEFYEPNLYEKYHDLLKYNFVEFYIIQLCKKLFTTLKILYYSWSYN